MIRELLANGQRYEYGAVLVTTPDGSIGAHHGGIHTSFNANFARLSVPADRSTIVGTVHNHPLATQNSHTHGLNNVISYNANQRYPSDQDWDILDAQVARGADPGRLSVFILDGFGTLREFKYADKDRYKSQTGQQRVNGEELPDPTNGCPSS